MNLPFTPKHLLTAAFFCILGLYALFQGRFLILGPRLEVSSPRDGEVLTEPLFSVVGMARNVNFLSLNDRPIFIDTEGRFSEKLIAAPGPSIMKLVARDRFGREKELLIHIVLK